MRHPFAAVVAIGLSLFSAAAMAQTSTRVCGVVTELAGDRLAVNTRAGDTVAIKLADPVNIITVVGAKLADIQPGSSVGIASVPQPDGISRALEVLVVPPGKTINPTDSPWDLAPSSTRTNGVVGSPVIANGRTITVNHSTGERKIVILDDVPMVSYEAGDRAMLVPGVQVIVFARKVEDGSFAAGAVAVGKNGAVPPM
jgi:hypothetical protein